MTGERIQHAASKVEYTSGANKMSKQPAVSFAKTSVCFTFHSEAPRLYPSTLTLRSRAPKVEAAQQSLGSSTVRPEGFCDKSLGTYELCSAGWPRLVPGHITAVSCLLKGPLCWNVSARSLAPLERHLWDVQSWQTDRQVCRHNKAALLPAPITFNNRPVCWVSVPSISPFIQFQCWSRGVQTSLFSVFCANTYIHLASLTLRLISLWLLHCILWLSLDAMAQ